MFEMPRFSACQGAAGAGGHVEAPGRTRQPTHPGRPTAHLFPCVGGLHRPPHLHRLVQTAQRAVQHLVVGVGQGGLAIGKGGGAIDHRRGGKAYQRINVVGPQVFQAFGDGLRDLVGERGGPVVRHVGRVLAVDGRVLGLQKNVLALDVQVAIR